MMGTYQKQGIKVSNVTFAYKFAPVNPFSVYILSYVSETQN